jgi:biopolymer transport protein ExbD
VVGRLSADPCRRAYTPPVQIASRKQVLSFLPGPFAAAAASVLLVVLFGVYVMPSQVISCLMGVPVNLPVEAEKLTIDRDGFFLAGSAVIAPGDLSAHLRAKREAEPWRPLEIQADDQVAEATIRDVLLAARKAGYTEAFISGRRYAL